MCIRDSMPPERHTIECDLAAVLAAAGVPAGPIRAAMTAAHRALVDPRGTFPGSDGDDVKAAAAAAAAAAAHTAREAARWASLAGELLARGAAAGAALSAAWDHVYSRGEASVAARRVASAAFRSAVAPYLDALRSEGEPASGVVRSSSYGGGALVLAEPLGWPASPNVAKALSLIHI